MTIISYWGVYHYRSMAGLLLCSTDSHFVAYFILYCWVLKINYHHYSYINQISTKFVMTITLLIIYTIKLHY